MKKALSRNNLDRFKELLSFGTDAIHVSDDNGWKLLHECAGNGLYDILVLLHENGADLNQRTDFGKGHSALELAQMFLPDDHDVIKYLVSNVAEPEEAMNEAIESVERNDNSDELDLRASADLCYNKDNDNVIDNEEGDRESAENVDTIMEDHYSKE